MAQVNKSISELRKEKGEKIEPTSINGVKHASNQDRGRVNSVSTCNNMRHMVVTVNILYLHNNHIFTRHFSLRGKSRV